MIECNSNYIITIPKLKDPADCPQPNGGPSVVQLRRPTRTNYLSGQISRLTGGLSAPQQRIVRNTLLQSHQNRLLLWSNFKSILRTVRSPLADCPQHTYVNPPETTTSLDEFLILTADRPAPLGGPSAVHSAKPPETTTSLDKILDSTADCPLSNSGPSAVQPCETLQRQHRLWTTST